MDVEATYSELCDLVNATLLPEPGGVVALAGRAVRMAELFEAMDHWIKFGGALPAQWQEVS